MSKDKFVFVKPEQNPESQKTQRLWIPGKFPTLNDLLNAKGRSKHEYYRLKKKWHEIVYYETLSQKLRPVQCAYFAFTWREATKGRDPSNVLAGGQKIILDALGPPRGKMLGASILTGDGWREILGIQDSFIIDRKNPGVELIMTENKYEHMPASLLVNLANYSDELAIRELTRRGIKVSIDQ